MMTAASGMKAQQLQVDTIANNIANANTSGFKRSRLAFKSLLYQTMREPGATSASGQQDTTGLQVGSGTEVSSSQKVFTQGNLELTGGELDLAVQGEGFFAVKNGSGEIFLTRNGNFRRDSEGKIVTTEGYTLEPPASVPQEVIGFTISRDGQITYFESNDDQGTTGDQIQLYRVPNPGGLKAQGGNYFTQTQSSGTAQTVTAAQDGAGEIVQGALERANVETVEELVGLIVAQRNYEVNSRAIKVSDEMLQQVNQLIR